MEAFEYASPTTVKDAIGDAGSNWGDAAGAGRRHRPDQLMKDFVATPKRVVNIKGIPELGGISQDGRRDCVSARR